MLNKKKELSQNIIEVKLMQRHEQCDINGMLFYTYCMAKLDFKNMFNKKFDRVFIEKCFFCGCNSDKSGKKVGKYIIQKTSFIDFFNRVQKRILEEKGYNKNYIEQLTFDSLLALRKGLYEHKYDHEHVLIYNEKYEVFSRLIYSKDHNKEKKIIKSFLSPFFKLSNKEINEMLDKSDNILTMYNNIYNLFSAENKQVLIYYTLYDNNRDVIPGNIKNKLNLCTEKDREKAGCVTRMVAAKMQSERLDKNKHDNKYDEFYKFAGVRIRKTKDYNIWDIFRKKRSVN